MKEQGLKSRGIKMGIVADLIRIEKDIKYRESLIDSLNKNIGMINECIISAQEYLETLETESN